MAFEYKPTKDETHWLEAGHIAITRMFSRSYDTSYILDECHKRDKVADRRSGFTAATKLERQGRYCTFFRIGLKALPMRDLHGIQASARDIAIAAAFIDHAGRVSDADRALIDAACEAHQAVHSRAVKAI